MITFQQAYDELAKVVADAPHGEDTVYERPRWASHLTANCLYSHRDGPGCVMGYWLYVYHGVTLEKLAAMDNVGSIAPVLRRLGIETTQRAVMFLDLMQDAQDRKIPWGDALASAARHAGKYPDVALIH